MIEMELTGVRVELPTNQPIVLLRERGGERYLPIWIGAAEAAAIALSLQGAVTPRPMTHDLMKSMLEELSVSVERISVTDLRESTFYATIDLQRNGDHLEISSRPSDAIALAVRMSVPIFASEEVLDEAAILIPDEDDDEVEKFREFLDTVTPEDFAGGDRAVEEDRHPDLPVHARHPDGHVLEPVVQDVLPVGRGGHEGALQPRERAARDAHVLAPHAPAAAMEVRRDGVLRVEQLAARRHLHAVRAGQLGHPPVQVQAADAPVDPVVVREPVHAVAVADPGAARGRAARTDQPCDQQRRHRDPHDPR